MSPAENYAYIITMGADGRMDGWMDGRE